MASCEYDDIIRWLKVSILELLADHNRLKEMQMEKVNRRLTRTDLVKLERKVELQISRLKKLRADRRPKGYPILPHRLA